MKIKNDRRKDRKEKKQKNNIINYRENMIDEEHLKDEKVKRKKEIQKMERKYGRKIKIKKKQHKIKSDHIKE